MGKVLIALAVLCFCTLVVPASAEVDTLSARRAAGTDYPTPTFKEVHEQFTRLVRNESGWISRADANGILKAVLYNGGGRDRERNRRGTGYGLDYTRLMFRMVQHSPRTFPVDSRFLVMLPIKKAAHVRRLRTYNNEWISTLALDCEEPEGWSEKRSGSWLGYTERCAELVQMTGEFLRGQRQDHCTGEPTTWGSEADARRPGGAIDKGWREVRCDLPGELAIEIPDVGTVTSCRDLRAAAFEHRGEALRELNNSRICARNRFWDWREPGTLSMR